MGLPELGPAVRGALDPRRRQRRPAARLLGPGRRRGGAGAALPARRALEPHRQRHAHRALAQARLPRPRHRLPRLRQEHGGLALRAARLRGRAGRLGLPRAGRARRARATSSGIRWAAPSPRSWRCAAPRRRASCWKPPSRRSATWSQHTAWRVLPVGLILTQEFDTLSKVPKIRPPLLVVHGTSDSVVPYEMGERLYAAAAGPKRFIKVEGGSHHNLSAVAHDQYRAGAARSSSSSRRARSRHPRRGDRGAVLYSPPCKASISTCSKARWRGSAPAAARGSSPWRRPSARARVRRGRSWRCATTASSSVPSPAAASRTTSWRAARSSAGASRASCPMASPARRRGASACPAAASSRSSSRRRSRWPISRRCSRTSGAAR